MKGFVVHQPFLTKQRHCLGTNVGQIYETLIIIASVWETEDKLFYCVCAVAFTQGGAIQLTGPGGEALQGVQALTLPSPATPQPGATILQYSPQPGDPGQQLLLSAGQVLVQGKTFMNIFKCFNLNHITSLLKSVRKRLHIFYKLS